MNKYVVWLKKEFWEILPTFAFFFVIFALIDLTRFLSYEKLELKYESFFMIVFSALMMAKVVLLSDLLPCIKRYEKEPLIYNTLWKTLIYLISSFVFRLLDHAIPTYMDHKSIALTLQIVGESLCHVSFWVIQGWLFILLLIFVAWRELIAAIGKEKAKELFFGKKAP